METIIFHPERDENAIQKAAAILRRGGLLGIPTETVYGLGADGLNEDAVRRIFEAKGRPQDNPLILHIPDASWLTRCCTDVPDTAYALASRFWPGPLTMILPRRSCVPLRTTGGLETVGVRCPNHPVTLAIIEAAGVPIAAPSGNTSGRPSPTTAQHMMDDMAGKIDGIVDGGPCAVGVESTIIDLTVQPPRLLRPGGLPLEALERVLGATRENLEGARVIRAFCNEDRQYAEFVDKNRELNRRQRRAGRVSGLMNPATFLLINAAIAWLIYTGAVRVDNGVLSAGQVVALYNYMSQILVELIKLANLIVSISKALACFDRVQTVIDLPEDATERAAGAALDRAADVAVRFDHVELVYPGAGAPSLEDVSFVAHRGETIGIVGPTGSGKSSLVNLIPRFYDATRGSVELYGQDVKRLSPEDIRRSVGMVPQKTVLFSGSIADNVRWGKTDASDADVLNAIDGAQGTDILSKKNEGMNAPVGQGGRALSGGQRQRVAIARALVRNADILILDDSASALDFATDARLRAAIRARQGSQTVFIVSQRASGVRYADRILVMDEGRVSAQGTHEELMQSSALYREIYFSQFPEGDHVCESR